MLSLLDTWEKKSADYVSARKLIGQNISMDYIDFVHSIYVTHIKLYGYGCYNNTVNTENSKTWQMQGEINKSFMIPFLLFFFFYSEALVRKKDFSFLNNMTKNEEKKKETVHLPEDWWKWGADLCRFWHVGLNI